MAVVRRALPVEMAAKGAYSLICSGCKKLKLEDKTWVSVGVDLQEGFHGELSHGICPACIRALYPEDADEILAMSDAS